MELILVDKSNYKDAIKIQNNIFPKEDGTLNILASLDIDAFHKITGMQYHYIRNQYYLAKENGKYIGITGLYNYNLEEVWLGWFGILSNYRNKGYGTELLRKTVDLATSLNFKTIRLYTDYIDNHVATFLYEKEDFVQEKYTFENLPYDCRIYSKSLTDNEVTLWDNKNLYLTYQFELEHMDNEKIQEILNKYNKYF